MPLSIKDFRFNQIVGTGATGLVCQAEYLIPNLPPARVAIKIVTHHHAIKEASQYLLVDGGLGNFFGMVHIDETVLPPEIKSAIDQKIPKPWVGLVLRFITQESLVKSQLLKSRQDRHGKTVLLHSGEWVFPAPVNGERVLVHQRLAGHWSTERRVAFILALIRAVQPFHKSGQAHGDLSPQNIVIENENVRVLDYGGNITFGTPGWQTDKKGIAGDIATIGLWIQRIFDRVSKPCALVGKKAIENGFPNLETLEKHFLVASRRGQNLKKRGAIAIIAVLVLSLAALSFKKKYRIDFVGQRALRDVEYRDEALPELRRRFIIGQGSERATIWPYLEKLGSQAYPASDQTPPECMLYFQGQSAVIQKSFTLQAGDKFTENLYLYEVTPAQIFLSDKVGRIKETFSQPAPFDQIHFGIAGKNVDLMSLLWTLCQFEKKEFVNLGRQEGSFSGVLVGQPGQILEKLSAMVVADNNQDFILKDIGDTNRIFRAELPAGMVLPLGPLQDRVESLLVFSNYQIEIDREVARTYVGRKRLEETMLVEDYINALISSFNYQIQWPKSGTSGILKIKN